MNKIDELLDGSIDIHIHSGPDPIVERRLDALEVARQAAEVGMRAIVLKSHEFPTTPITYTVSQLVQDIDIFGSICLNHEVGGLNSHAVEASARMGAKVLWMPTNASATWMKKRGVTGKGISLLNRKGELLPVVKEILDIVKEYHMVLSTGHISVPEITALIDEARNRGITRVVITHPLLRRTAKEFPLEEQRRLAEKGAYIEHCWSHILPLMVKLDPMKMVEATRAVGVEHCVWSTDLGQDYNPAPAEGMRMMIATMLKCGFSEEETSIMIKDNPAKLLGMG
jgi:hypothetical protein